MRHIVIDGHHVHFGSCPTGKFLKREGDKFVGADVSGSSSWGGIGGTLSNQTDLKNALDGKAANDHNHDIAYAALDHAHSYDDLTDKPTLGDAASKNVGTGAGDVAAGNHTHPGGGSALDAWPVGSVYIAVDSTSPATRFGGGTWAAFGAGKMLVGLDANDTDFDTAEETGGVKTVTLTAAQSGLPQHTHTQNAHTHVQDAHSHTIPVGATDDTSAPFDRADAGTNTGGANATTATGTATAVNQSATAVNQNAGPTDAAAAHTNMPPFIVVYMWKRTA